MTYTMDSSARDRYGLAKHWASTGLTSESIEELQAKATDPRTAYRIQDEHGYNVWVGNHGRKSKAVSHPHRHTPVASLTREYGWTGCVVDYHTGDDGSHGNIVREYHCRCGAVKLTEINCSDEAATGWQAEA